MELICKTERLKNGQSVRQISPSKTKYFPHTSLQLMQNKQTNKQTIDIMLEKIDKLFRDNERLATKNGSLNSQVTCLKKKLTQSLSSSPSSSSCSSTTAEAATTAIVQNMPLHEYVDERRERELKILISNWNIKEIPEAPDYVVQTLLFLIGHKDGKDFGKFYIDRAIEKIQEELDDIENKILTRKQYNKARIKLHNKKTRLVKQLKAAEIAGKFEEVAKRKAALEELMKNEMPQN